MYPNELGKLSLASLGVAKSSTSLGLVGHSVALAHFSLYKKPCLPTISDVESSGRFREGPSRLPFYSPLAGTTQVMVVSWCQFNSFLMRTQSVIRVESEVQAVFAFLSLLRQHVITGLQAEIFTAVIESEIQVESTLVVNLTKTELEFTQIGLGTLKIWPIQCSGPALGQLCMSASCLLKIETYS